MKFKSKLDNIVRNYNGEYQVVFTAPRTVLEELASLKEYELQIEVDKFRNKRSLNANAYCWKLITELSNKTKVDKWSLYKELLVRYSNSYEYLIVKPQAIKSLEKVFRVIKNVGEGQIKGNKAIQIQGYYGSSTFNTKEMATFIDGIVSECKELGIETQNESEIKELVKLWK